MSSSSATDKAPASSRKPLVIVLAVIGVIALIVGVLYLAAGSSLPGFLTAGSHVKSGNHIYRGIVSLVVGVVLLVLAWISGRSKSAPARAAAS